MEARDWSERSAREQARRAETGMTSEGEGEEMDLLTERQAFRIDRRTALAGALGAMAVGVAGRAGAVSAQTATAEAQADPEADPEVESSPAADEVIDGTPVGSAGELTVYSGRNEELIGPLVPVLEALTGVDLEVRYGNTAELAVQILDEGDNSPAGLYIAQDAGALGQLANEGRLATLPDDVLDLVDPRFRSPDGLWVGLSGRARVAAYNTDQLAETDLPASVLDLTDERWRGQVGWAPENGSFQAFVTALRVLQGEDVAREWLQGMQDNETVTFENNGSIVRAVASGEIGVGLVNHYYLYEIEAEEGDLPVANHFFAAGDPGSLINVAGAGIVEGSDQAEQALATIRALLSERAQTYFAEETFEYPLAAGVEQEEALTPLAEIDSPELDLSDLDDLQGTIDLLVEVGII